MKKLYFILVCFYFMNSWSQQNWILIQTDLSDNDMNTIQFRFKATTGDGIGGHGLKFEGGTGGPAETELLFASEDNDWHTFQLDFPGGLGTFTKMVIFTDRGNANTGTYLIDDIELIATPCASPEFPIYFDAPEDDLFFGGGATVSINGSDELEVIGDGSSWDNAGVNFCDPIDLSDDSMNTLRFWVRSTTAAAMEDHTHLVSFQPVVGASEMNFMTTGQDWTFVQLDFGPGLGSFADMFLFPDSPTLGIFADNFDGGTYLFDDMELGETLSTQDFTDVEFNVYPNPTIDNWTIMSTQNMNSIQVYNVLGKQVISVAPNALETIIDASSLNSGIYFARINSEGRTETIRLVKK